MNAPTSFCRGVFITFNPMKYLYLILFVLTTTFANAQHSTGCQLPLPLFETTQIDNYTILFYNITITQGPTTYLWLFPGGEQDTAHNSIYNFPAPGSYPVSLIATNACGSDTTTLNINVFQQPTAINEVKEMANISMYPNPANTVVTLNLQVEKPVTGIWQIVNMMGQLVYAERISFASVYTKTIDVSMLAKGLYSLIINTEDGVSSSKLVVE